MHQQVYEFTARGGVAVKKKMTPEIIQNKSKTKTTHAVAKQM